ncbi:MAG: carbamoyl-phosphate synthase large subunit [Syntrophomonas sp.]|uniref:carbamoyl-phosphate synthase large subunit n=1 Tax=Syntrophomonas sp. TaxID=2053627 RepID=UPI0026017DFE|nr:carbamoyl-phosphate synthase large subunit [Syntrophomonas sp.]MDD3879419.1 carbamoyl-phosphate synthase large subunit [Syntrophomonas sp.]MDD4627002.1 carbamoyl-phosphate synthase large subunit [Syntrophomonas sp.]
MPLNENLRKVLVIGSGPIIIGQAAEFDYAGTQACRALKEEGIDVVLLNTNPATIMTDANIADHVYFEPITVETVNKIIAREKPDGIIANLGGQVGLNMALALDRAGILEKTGVPLLGMPLDAIARAEDREKFKATMQEIGEPIPESDIVHSVEEAIRFAEKIGYPVIVRPAYTLGGTGGGTAGDDEELQQIVLKGLKNSPINQALIERSVAGFKEIEFEVMRDANDNCITICSMENVDPVGIHTGDSIVVAPAQTLSDEEYQMLRASSLKIIRHLKIVGGCNVQYALDPFSKKYYVIEVNPRVSRSSALASKATGYPIAKVTTKLAIGYTLDEIPNAVTGKNTACFEPAIDYVVLKVPRWPFDKFVFGDRKLGTQMKATGEVMAIDRSYEAAFLKSIRSLEIGLNGMRLPELQQMKDEDLRQRLEHADDERTFIIAEALSRRFSLDEIWEITRIDKYFLKKMKNIIDFARVLENKELDCELLREAKKIGFSDFEIAAIKGQTEEEIRKLRKEAGILPTYKSVDTCAAEFDADTPYFYSCYEEENEAWHDPNTRKILVIGAGPIRIGQGVEFDYCSVHCVWALRDAGIKAIIINNNPETVSTDFDTSDRLYFEPLVYEDVMNIIDEEQPEGVIVQFGGQTAINLANALNQAGVKILGTSNDSIDRAEDRERFDLMVEKLAIPRPPGKTVFSVEEAVKAAGKIGYPVLLRPSYVLGGRAMEIVYNVDELRQYMQTAVNVNHEHPVLVDKYLLGKEIEVDAVCDGKQVLIPGIMQHIERAGVHSGDSMAVFPAHDLSPVIKDKVVDYTIKLARELEVKGLINIQFVEFEDELYVLEVNPRSSRTVPFISKVTGIPLVKLGTEIILGKNLKELGYNGGLQPEPEFYAIKVPVFSFNKLEQVDITLGPEMKSTGEVLGINRSLKTAIYKGLLEAGVEISHKGTIVATIADKDKAEAIPILYELSQLGFKLVATEGTAMALRNNGIAVETVKKIKEGSPNIVDLIRQGKVDFVVNTLTHGRMPFTDGFQIRRAAVELNVPCLTSLDTLRVVKDVITEGEKTTAMEIMSLQEYVKLIKPQESPMR